MHGNQVRASLGKSARHSARVAFEPIQMEDRMACVMANPPAERKNPRRRSAEARLRHQRRQRWQRLVNDEGQAPAAGQAVFGKTQHWGASAFRHGRRVLLGICAAAVARGVGLVALRDAVAEIARDAPGAGLAQGYGEASFAHAPARYVRSLQRHPHRLVLNEGHVQLSFGVQR